MHTPLLHGAAGNLDELLVCGIGLAVILVLVFVVELRAKDKPASGSPDTKAVTDEQAH